MDYATSIRCRNKILVMKILAIVLALFVVSCAKHTSNVGRFSDLVFISKGEIVDVVDVDGINLGSLYGSSPMSPKNVGHKTYVTSQGISVEENVTISWKYSSNRDEQTLIKATIKRAGSGIPQRIPDNHALNLIFNQGAWEMNMSNR
jgi:hypothetical protein